MKSGKNPTIASYSLSGFENGINSIVHWIYFYRLLIVFTALSQIITCSIIAWIHSNPGDRVKNLAAVLGCGSIVIGIFYAILNYEMNYIRYRSDRKASQKNISYLVASEWQKETILNHLKVTRILFEKNKHLIYGNRSGEFFDIVEHDEQARAALISIFNFLECVALGIYQEILDEEFMKLFFRGIFKSYLNDYQFYIEYRRKKNNTPDTWINFTELAMKWRQ